MSACEVVALLPALCSAGFAGWPSSSPPNGRLVLLLGVLGRGGRLGSVPVVPVALGRHGTLWWCAAPLMVGHALALLGLPPGGACPSGEKNFENWYDMPSPALERALHAEPVILYIVVPSGFPFGLACADRMYTPVGSKAPLVLFDASPCSLWEPRGAVPAWWCGVGARARWPVALARSAGCRARCVMCRALLRGSGGVCVGGSVRLPEARVVWLAGTPAFSVAWRFSGPQAVVATTSVL